MYEILGYTMQSSFDHYRRSFLEVIGSFDRLRDREALNVQPQRIKLHRVSETMSLRQAFQRADVNEDRWPELALVNNAALDDMVEAGTLLKTIAGRPAGSRQR